jgi:tetratricopeptide (TPR) repeat protein
LTQEQRLSAQSVAAWGGGEWQRYSELSNAGDDAFLADDFATAIESYSAASAAGDQLLARSVQIVERALAAAAEAFAAGTVEVALRQYDVVLGVDPEHAGAKAGRARAERLPEVLALVRQADEERERGNAQAALARYREALAIDPSWGPARAAADEVSGSLQNAEFDRAMSLGFSALAAENYGDAERQFRVALTLQPQARAAQEGLAQAEQGAKLDQIALTEARALAFERRELWDQAIALYRAMLATDANLVFAQTGLERAMGRAGLDAKLTNLIDNPTLLFSDTVLADARKLLDEARAQPESGVRLEEQVGKLARLVDLAATPIAVQIQSDRLTDVTLYRVGALGVFATKQVDLRPGTYTAIGSRDGYRDVRQTFTVLPGRELPPISVVCVEPI